MPKLPVVTPKVLISVLEKAGFVYVFGSGSHRVMKHKNGKRATVPMHGRDIPKGTLLAILRDIELSKEEFVGLLKKKK